MYYIIRIIIITMFLQFTSGEANQAQCCYTISIIARDFCYDNNQEYMVEVEFCYPSQKLNFYQIFQNKFANYNSIHNKHTNIHTYIHKNVQHKWKEIVRKYGTETTKQNVLLLFLQTNGRGGLLKTNENWSSSHGNHLET